MTARDDLAAQQATLLRALLAGEPAPGGFPPHRAAAEARSLRSKRRKATAYLEPGLADELDERFAGLFDAYALAHPRQVGTGAHADAGRFAEWLVEREELPGSRGLPAWRPLCGRRSR